MTVPSMAVSMFGKDCPLSGSGMDSLSRTECPNAESVRRNRCQAKVQAQVTQSAHGNDQRPTRPAAQTARPFVEYQNLTEVINPFDPPHHRPWSGKIHLRLQYFL